ncbi:MAG: alpha/beta hydrolase [Clostridia bacterium]
MALLHVNYFSNVLGMCMNMDVILPQQTKGQIGMEGAVNSTSYPTLYLLHGMSDDHTIWQRRTSIERYVERYGHRCCNAHGASPMVYGYGSRSKILTFISEELPAICRSFFPICRTSARRHRRWAVHGRIRRLEAGVEGRRYLGAVASPFRSCGHRHIFFDSYTNDSLFFDIFGSKERATGSDDDLFALADKLARSGKPLPKLYMWCGTEDPLYADNAKLRDSLRTLGYDLTYEESAGNHSWTYWDEKIQTVLRWLPLGK